MMRKIAIFTLVIAALGLASARPAAGQDWFKTGTGLGVSKARVAVPEFAAKTTQAQPLEKTFHDVLWADLDYSGILELVSPSFYPAKIPSQPNELNAADWSNAPVNAYMLAYGNLTTEGSTLAVAGFLSDVHSPAAPMALQRFTAGRRQTRMRGGWRTSLRTTLFRG